MASSLRKPVRHKYQQHPVKVASWISQLTWSWFFPLLNIGKRRQVCEDDVWELPTESRSEYLYDLYTKHKLAHPIKTLNATLLSLFWRRWVAAGCFYGCWCVCAAVQPLLVSSIIKHLEDESSNTHDGMSLAVLLFISTLGYSMFINHKFAQLVRNGTRVRSLLMTLVYRKSLRLALTSPVAAGEATNLMSNDCEKIYEAQIFLHYLWASPLFVIVVIIMAVYSIGVAALIGFGLLILIIPIQAHYGKRVGKAKRRMLPKIDKRTDLFAQVLSGILVVKLYNWEVPYAEQIKTMRDDEVEDLKEFNAIRAGIRAVLFIAPALIPSATIVAYVALGNDLTLEITFLAISFFSIVRFPTLIIPMAYSMFHEMKVSLKRIDDFLKLDDAPFMLTEAGEADKETREGSKMASIYPSTGSMHDDVAVLTDVSGEGGGGSDGGYTTVENSVRSPAWAPLYAPSPLDMDWTSLSWDNAANARVLADVAIHIDPGALIAVVGSVGAGKTALLLGLLGELYAKSSSKRDGSATPAQQSHGAVGYFSQEPHILNGTFEDNVCFGLPFIADAFDEVVHASCLDADIDIMPAGAHTEIGENGVNLSGGQKSRVAFARLLYHRRRCSIFLIDDPFASVDIHVGQKLFDRGINGMLKDCTRVVVVSSQTDLLRSADVILTIKNGAITARYRSRTVSSVDGYPRHCTNNNAENSDCRNNYSSSCSSSNQNNNSETIPTAEANEETVDREEIRKHGGVSLAVYLSYFEFANYNKSIHGSKALLGFVVASYVFSQCIRVMCDVWLAWWADVASRGAGSAVLSELQTRPDTYWMWTLAIWNVTNIFLAFSRSLWCASISVRASRNLHAAVLSRLLHAPLGYFQQNPPGRVLNRLSTDLHRVDTLLPDFLYQFLDNFFVLFSAVILSVIAVPWLLLLLLIITPVYYHIQATYRTTSRELNRLDGVTKSPIFGTCSESLMARVTMRALRIQQYYTERCSAMIDKNLKIYCCVRLLERWISTYLNLAASVFGFTLVVVAMLARDHFNPVMVGLGLVYCLQLMGLGSWTMMLFVQVESNMTSLERVTDLCHIPVQEPSESKHTYTTPPPDWPREGAIEIVNAKLRYRDDLPLALSGFYLKIQPCEKVGICGRTGAGKSSILALMFRLFEPEEGSTICIDGIDITKVALSVLRKRLSIVPQDPILFNGSVRSNLDPFLQHSDLALWQALDKVTLKAFVETLPSTLDESVGIAGDKLSFGQRQLICIARALLKDSRILFCDEATSSVDRQTDEIIQQVFRDAFKDRTVLTIAHRIDTIIDSDKIVVMSDGAVVEVGSFDALQQKTNGHFASMLTNKNTKGKFKPSTSSPQTTKRTALPSNDGSSAIQQVIPQKLSRHRNASMIPIDTRASDSARVQALADSLELEEKVSSLSTEFAFFKSSDIMYHSQSSTVVVNPTIPTSAAESRSPDIDIVPRPSDSIATAIDPKISIV